jgi:hypothetical protein
MPPLVLELELAVETVAPDGSAQIRSTVVRASARAGDGASVPEPVMAQMTASLRGTAFTATLAPDGRVTGSRIESAGSLPPAVAGQLAELEKSVGQVAMPLPHEAIGVGATWTSRRESAQQGLTLTAAPTTTVTAIDGDRLSFTTATTMTAPGTAQSGGLTLSDVGGGGTATGTVDLARLSIDSKIDLGFHGTMTQAGSAARIEWDLTMAARPIDPGAQGAHNAP